VSDGEGEGLEFEAASFDEGSQEMLQANAHLEGAAGESAEIQGQAGAQLRQWMPTVPAADTIDEVEATAGRALTQATDITRDDAGKLLTQKQNMLDTENGITARINQITRDSTLPDTGGSDQTPVPVDESASYNAHIEQQINDRVDELKNDGPGAHGPQRHLEVSDTQLQERLGTPSLNPDGTPQLRPDGFVKSTGKIDPMTGTTTDAVTGGVHRVGPITTRFDSAGDYAYVESILRARASVTGDSEVTAPIKDLLGDGAHSGMTGYYIDPGNPADYRSVDFQGGLIKAVYRYDVFQRPHLYTMYPEPAPGFQP
jgi:hypothetical protein